MMDNALHCDIDLPSQIMSFVSLKLRSGGAGRTGTITCKSDRAPSADSPRLGPPENRAGTPVQLAIDFLPLPDLSIVGSLFNLAINWGKLKSNELFHFLPVRMRDSFFDVLCIKYK